MISNVLKTTRKKIYCGLCNEEAIFIEESVSPIAAVCPKHVTATMATNSYHWKPIKRINSVGPLTFELFEHEVKFTQQELDPEGTSFSCSYETLRILFVAMQVPLFRFLKVNDMSAYVDGECIIFNQNELLFNDLLAFLKEIFNDHN